MEKVSRARRNATARQLKANRANGRKTDNKSPPRVIAETKGGTVFGEGGEQAGKGENRGTKGGLYVKKGRGRKERQKKGEKHGGQTERKQSERKAKGKTDRKDNQRKSKGERSCEQGKEENPERKEK